MKKILILGAGFAGLTLASELDAFLRRKADITLVDRNSHMSVGFSMQWVLAGRRNPEEGLRPYSSFTAKGVKFIRDEITSIDTVAKRVKTKSLNLEFDELVIALGAELVPETVPGLAETSFNLCNLDSVVKLKTAIVNFTKGTLVVMVSSLPFKCPPSPYEYALLIDEILRKREVRDKIRLIVTSPETQPLPIAGKAVGEAMKSLLTEQRIEYLTEHKPKSVAAKNKTIVYENGFSLNFDLLAAMPPHQSPDILKKAGLTDVSGFVPVTLGTFATSKPHVFAVGDVALMKLPNGAIHPKAGIFAEAQALTLAKNIAAQVGVGKPVAYEGRGVCFVDTGQDKAAQVNAYFMAKDGPKVTLQPPSAAGLLGKRNFEKERFIKWFGA